MANQYEELVTQIIKLAKARNWFRPNFFKFVSPESYIYYDQSLKRIIINTDCIKMFHDVHVGNSVMDLKELEELLLEKVHELIPSSNLYEIELLTIFF